MFTLDTRVSAALAARPELRTLLPAFHPAFEKLNHPVLGRIMPKLVTVRDAARVAGVDPEALLEVMNLSGPPAEVAPLAEVERVRETAPAWLEGAAVEVLDLQPMLAAGAEPFPAIMAALRALPTGAVLQTLTPFEPAPLRSLLDRRGWESHAAWQGEVCTTSFFRRPDAHLAPAEAPARRPRPGPRGHTLDLRGLEPPQPLQAVLAVLDSGALPLELRHHREPALLYPRLEERGLQWTVARDGDDYLIAIQPGADHDAG
jgi:hypothetical protein